VKKSRMTQALQVSRTAETTSLLVPVLTPVHLQLIFITFDALSLEKCASRGSVVTNLENVRFLRIGAPDLENQHLNKLFS